MATDDGVRWLLVGPGSWRIDSDAAARGRLRWTGKCWQPGGGWGSVETAHYHTTTERNAVCRQAYLMGQELGGDWVQVFVNVDPEGAGA